MRQVALIGAATAALALTVASASGYTLSYGGTRATACYNAATFGDTSADAIRTCDRALSEDALTGHDRASTLVNRGAIYVAQGRPDRAMQDFDDALAIEPNNADAHANRGVALLYQRNFQTAISELTQGITLHPTRPERAYFARARAYEETGNIRGAYNDFRQAANLAPGWEPARLELTRFQVRAG